MAIVKIQFDSNVGLQSLHARFASHVVEEAKKVIKFWESEHSFLSSWPLRVIVPTTPLSILYPQLKVLKALQNIIKRPSDWKHLVSQLIDSIDKSGEETEESVKILTFCLLLQLKGLPATQKPPIQSRLEDIAKKWIMTLEETPQNEGPDNLSLEDAMAPFREWDESIKRAILQSLEILTPQEACHVVALIGESIPNTTPENFQEIVTALVSFPRGIREDVGNHLPKAIQSVIHLKKIGASMTPQEGIKSLLKISSALEEKDKNLLLEFLDDWFVELYVIMFAYLTNEERKTFIESMKSLLAELTPHQKLNLLRAEFAANYANEMLSKVAMDGEWRLIQEYVKEVALDSGSWEALKEYYADNVWTKMLEDWEKETSSR
jgi:hypothetical protein